MHTSFEIGTGNGSTGKGGSDGVNLLSYRPSSSNSNRFAWIFSSICVVISVLEQRCLCAQMIIPRNDTWCSNFWVKDFLLFDLKMEFLDFDFITSWIWFRSLLLLRYSFSSCFVHLCQTWAGYSIRCWLVGVLALWLVRIGQLVFVMCLPSRSVADSLVVKSRKPDSSDSTW